MPLRSSSATTARSDGPPAALVFTRGLLPRSETFIEDHVTSLRRYRPCLVGMTAVENGLRPAGVETRLTGARGGGLERLRLAFSPRAGILDAVAADTRAALVHAHFVVNALLLLPFVQRSNLPLIVTAHGHDVAADPATMRPVDRLLYATRLRALGRRADAILCVSDAIRDLAVERGLPADKCRVAPLGIPLARFHGLRRRPAPGRLLFVGRLVEKKGLAHLIEAAARIRRSGIAVDLRVIGDGPERPRLDALNRQLGSPARFLGAQPRARVLRELAEAQAFALPSARGADGDSEGLPIALLEAQAAGVPVVAFDNGPARGAVAAGRTGILVTERDTAALTLAIRLLLTDADLRERMSAAAMHHVADRFNIVDRTAVLEDIYDEMVARRRLSAAGVRRDPTRRMEACA